MGYGDPAGVRGEGCAEGAGGEVLQQAEAVAGELAAAFSRKKSVVGVVYLGALARGCFDQHSDIDIVVFKRKGARLGWPREKEYTFKGFVVDLEVRDYEEELSRPWQLEERWVYLNARIHYDPSGSVKRLIELKAPLTPRERLELPREELKRAEWSAGDALTWVHRGSLTSAHFLTVTALRHALRAVVLVNGLPPPPDKWLFYTVTRLEKKPEHLEELVREALVAAELSGAEVERRVAAVAQIAAWVRSQLGSYSADASTCA